MKLDFFTLPFRVQKPRNDSEACYVMDGKNNHVAMMMWPGHTTEDTSRAEEETYAVARVMATAVMDAGPHGHEGELLNGWYRVGVRNPVLYRPVQVWYRWGAQAVLSWHGDVHWRRPGEIMVPVQVPYAWRELPASPINVSEEGTKISG